MKRVFTAALLIGCISFFSGCAGQTENELQATPTPEVSTDTTPVPTAVPTPQPDRRPDPEALRRADRHPVGQDRRSLWLEPHRLQWISV